MRGVKLEDETVALFRIAANTHTLWINASEERLDRDQLRKCMTHGAKRVELVKAVTKELETLSVEMESQFNECAPDALAATLISALMRAAKVVFGVKQRGRTPAQSADAKQLAVLLRQ